MYGAASLPETYGERRPIGAPMPDDILRKIRGDDLGRAVLTLSPIETTAAETVEAVFDASGLAAAFFYPT